MNSYKVVLVGQPNAGKSTLFNLLSDIKTNCANFPGTSVNLTTCRLQEDDLQIEMIDLPGLYSLNSLDEAERVTLKYLTEEKVDLILNIIDSSLLARSLELTIELLELQIPLIIVCNMEDQALRKGFRLDLNTLEKITGCPAHSISALYNKGIKELLDLIKKNLFSPRQVTPLHYTAHIEEQINLIAAKLQLPENNKLPQRFYAIKLLENPEIVPEELFSQTASLLAETITRIEEEHQRAVYETICYERHHLAMKLAEETAVFIKKKSFSRLETIDRFLLHPILGNFLMFLFFLLFFTIIYFSGKYISGFVELLLQPAANFSQSLAEGNRFVFFSIDGLYQGFSGALGIVLPYLFPLLFLNALVQDSGYLARIAFLTDSIMHRLGLHGKAVVCFINGTACTVPALFSTRIMERRRDRFLLAMLLPLVPCSARNTIILALSAAFLGPVKAVLIYLFLIFAIGLSGFLLARFSSQNEGLVMEMPALRRPLFSSAIKSSFYQLKDFFKTVFPVLLISSLFLNWIFYFRLETPINQLFSFLIKSLLGLPEQLGSTLLFGFLRKELILTMAAQAMGVDSISALGLSVEQIFVFITFSVLYFPCLATFIVLKKEFGWKTAFLAALFSLAVATLFANLSRLFFLLVKV